MLANRVTLYGMGLISEYISKNMSGKDLEDELLKLIKQYNKIRGTFLVVYSSALTKNLPQTSIGMDDFHTLHDMLRNTEIDKLDVYLETPGGSGEAAEEIVRMLRKKANSVTFVISGEAKSAGTLMVLSGDEILMTESGSLGPIDAQVKIGRSSQSAYDYMDWIKTTKKEAEKNNKLNPVENTMVAQISPGELEGVNNALHFARDLVAEWLPKYMFKDLTVSEDGKTKITPRMKKEMAKKIVGKLINHKMWRSHGRSIKIKDLEKIGLPIEKVDDDEDIKEIVYRIQVVIKMLYATTNAFKIFATQDEKIFGNATLAGTPPNIVQNKTPIAEIDVDCPKCKTKHRLYMKFEEDPATDEKMKQNKKVKFPADGKLKCSCGFELDLTGMRNQVEQQVGKKMLP